MKIRWKARCLGCPFLVESRGGPVEAKKIRWIPGSKVESREERGRMDGAVGGVSQELSLHLERRVATEVVYYRMSVPGRNGMLLPGTVMWL